ncbi:MAG: T9SS type A sorting domain-containing protein, partial [Bacteroidia bacterium]
IVFNYDQNGNRILRQLVVSPCGGNQRKSHSDTAKQDTLLILNTKVYPNPANDKVTVELEQENNAATGTSTISLFDLNGREINTQSTGLNKLQIDVSTLPVGTYLLKIARGDKQASYSILKN